MYRAYWAIPRTLKTSKGEQMNTVFGVASMLLTIFKKEEPDSLLFCFDAGEETFRHQENATYKEGRAETPDDFYVQIPRILALVDAFGFPSVSNKQYEADDYLCAYATAAEKEGMRVTTLFPAGYRVMPQRVQARLDYVRVVVEVEGGIEQSDIVSDRIQCHLFPAEHGFIIFERREV